MLNWWDVFCSFGVFLLFCLDGFVGVGDDVNCVIVFFVKENIDEFFFFLIELYCFLLGVIEWFLFIDVLFYVVDVMFIGVILFFIE